MDRIRRRWLLTVPAFVGLAVAAASLNALAQDADTRVLRLVQETEVQSLNQNVQSTRGAMRITNEIMETPVRAVIENDALVLKPLLATEWNQVDEHTWHFKIVKASNSPTARADCDAFVKTPNSSAATGRRQRPVFAVSRR